MAVEPGLAIVAALQSFIAWLPQLISCTLHHMISWGGGGASTLTPFKPVEVLDIVFGVPYLQRQPKCKFYSNQNG